MFTRKRTKEQHPCNNNAGLPECNLVAEIAEKQRRINHLENVIIELDRMLSKLPCEQLAMMCMQYYSSRHRMYYGDALKLHSSDYVEARNMIKRYMTTPGHSIPKLIEELQKIDELHTTRRENVFEMKCLQSEVDQAKAKLGIE